MRTSGSDGPTDEDGSRTACCGRRALLGSAGAGVAAALAACGGGQASGKAGNPGGQATGAMKESITKASVPVGGGRVFAGQQVVVTQPKAGEFKAFSAICPHQGCLVGDVAKGVITCPCHGSQFDITTGAVRQGPATQPLAPKTVTVKGDGISVR